MIHGEAYNRELFQLVHGSLQGASDRLVRRITWIASNIPSGVESILDVGSGRCFLSNLLVDRGYRVISFDLVSPSLKTSQGCRLQGSARAIPIKDRSVDLVVCVEVLEHLTPDVRAATLHEMWRVARSHILITVPNNENLREALMRCDHCGYVFHPWGHLHSFEAESIRTMYPTSPCSVITSGDRAPRYFAPLLAIRQRIFGTYSFDTLVVCPACANCEIQQPRRSFPVKVIDRLNYWLGLQREAGWLLAVFDKRGTDGRACLRAQVDLPR